MSGGLSSSHASIGATRNRTTAFVRRRDEARSTRALFEAPTRETEALLSSRETLPAEPASVGSIPTLPPAWVDASEALAEDMTRIRKNLDELPKLHARALRATFDDEGAGAPQVQADSKAREITRALQLCEGRLRSLRSHGREEEDAVKKNVQAQAASQLQALSMEFRKAQKSYLQRLRKQREDGSRSFVPGLELKLEDGTRDNGLGLAMAQEVVGQSDAAIVREREREIAAVAESVEELAMVMKDLSALVIDQGSLLDRIDYNIEQVGAHVEEGLEQLRRAERTQKKSRTVVCILMLVGAIIFMLVILVLKNLIFF